MRVAKISHHRPLKVASAGARQGPTQNPARANYVPKLLSYERLLCLSLMPAIIAYASVPTQLRKYLDIPCIFKSILGFNCPGCGLKSALIALMYGDFRKSLEFNENVIFVSLLAFYLFLRQIYFICYGEKNV